jgi:hypothetical protein
LFAIDFYNYVSGLYRLISGYIQTKLYTYRLPIKRCVCSVANRYRAGYLLRKIEVDAITDWLLDRRLLTKKKHINH